MQHQRHRMHEVVAAVAQLLVGIGRVAAAAELQEGINDIQGTGVLWCIQVRGGCCVLSFGAFLHG
jgi:hypothetical protein